MKSISEFLPILQEVQTIKYELASGHIWLEEHLMGNKDVDFEKDILQRQKRICRTLKELQSTIEKNSLPDSFLQNFLLIQEKTISLKLLAKKRVEAYNLKGYDNDLTKEFHIVYKELQVKLRHFDEDLKVLLHDKREKRSVYFVIAVLVFLSFNIVMFFLLFKIKSSNLQYYKQLVEQGETFETMFQNSSDAVSLIKNGLIYDCNKALVDLLGVKNKKEIINLSPSDFSPILQPDGQDSYAKCMDIFSTLSEKKSERFEWLHKRLDGKEFYAEIVLTSIKLNNEEIVHGVWRDITDRKELEKANKKNQKIVSQQLKMAQMGSMLNAIAHQWKQPLAKINARLIKLSTTMNLSREKEEVLESEIEAIEDITAYMGDTIENFRTYFQPSKDKNSFKLYDTINKSYFLSSLQDSDMNITFKNKCDEEVSYYGYEDELLQVLIILFNNAQEAHEENKTDKPYVSVRVLSYTSYVEIVVLDNAGGIDDEIAEKIFYPYFTTKSLTKNSGIGLSTAKMIVENGMNSSILYRKVGEISCFVIILKG